MTCADVRAMAESYLAGELPGDTTHAIATHLESCADCREEFARRHELRRTLRRAVLTSADLAPDAAFMARLRESVRESAPSSHPRFGRAGVWLALAAGIAFVLIAGWQMARVNRVHPDDLLTVLIAHATGDHRYCALQHALDEPPISLEEAARRYGPVYAPLQDIVASAAPVREGAVELLGAHSCVFDGRRFAHVIVRRDDHVISILLTPVDGANGDLSADVGAYQASEAFTVAGFLVKGHAGFVVSDLAEEENLALARALAPVLQAYFARA